MSIQTEYIPELELPITTTLNEQAVVGFDTAALQTQLGVTISSVAWSVEDALVLSTGTPGNTGDTYFVPVTALIVGCSHVIANVTTSDSNQNPTLLFMKVNVVEPKCGGI